MWRRLASSQLKTLINLRSAPKPHRFSAGAVSSSPASFRPAATFFSCHFSTESGNVATKKIVEDVMPIATGHEREELAAELEGKDVLAINYPVGPFGTKEAPAVIQSVYNKRIVGCPGGEGEDEHDVVWCWLEKDMPLARTLLLRLAGLNRNKSQMKKDKLASISNEIQENKEEEKTAEEWERRMAFVLVCHGFGY